MIAVAVERKKIADPRDDALYWRSRPAHERIVALEAIRAEYNEWKYGNVQPGFQRVFERVKRA